VKERSTEKRDRGGFDVNAVSSGSTRTARNGESTHASTLMLKDGTLVQEVTYLN
jgi:hypothetical protein